jgi:hypothetical protein
MIYVRMNGQGLGGVGRKREKEMGDERSKKMGDRFY